MPTWLQNQMKRAFYEKDRYQIKTVKPVLVLLQKKTLLIRVQFMPLLH